MGGQHLGPGGKYYGPDDVKKAMPHLEAVLKNPRAGLCLDVLGKATNRTEEAWRKALVQSPLLPLDLKDLYSRANELTKSAAVW